MGCHSDRHTNRNRPCHEPRPKRRTILPSSLQSLAPFESLTEDTRSKEFVLDAVATSITKLRRERKKNERDWANVCEERQEESKKIRREHKSKRAKEKKGDQEKERKTRPLMVSWYTGGCSLSGAGCVQAEAFTSRPKDSRDAALAK